MEPTDILSSTFLSDKDFSVALNVDMKKMTKTVEFPLFALPQTSGNHSDATFLNAREEMRLISRQKQQTVKNRCLTFPVISFEN